MRNSIPRLRISALSLAFSVVALFAAAHAGAQSHAAAGRLKTERFKGREVAAGQVIVKFRKTAAPLEVEQAKNGADVELDKKVGGRGARLFRSRSKDAAALVREFSARPDVAYAEPNYVIRLTAAPDDPRFAEQWALRNTVGTAGADIGALSAWDVTTGSRGNVVAVVDTGVDYNHPDLAANVWSAPAAFTVEIAGQSITCAAGTHGFDALTNTCDPMDDHNHGTHVAGIAGASGNNGTGVAGVSQTASIMGLRFLDAQGNGTLEGAINAIEFAVQAKRVFGAGANVRVLSNSWGWNGDASQALLDQINAAAASDMLFVAGAGNSGADDDAAPFYPASYEAANVVSVAATDNNDALAVAPNWASNYGRASVDLAAPGSLILSTVVGGSYDWFSGTSMATPHVSGAAVLVLSRCSLDTAGLKGALLGNVDQVASLSEVTATGGRLNVGKALGSCVTAASAPTPTPATTPTPQPTPAPTPAAPSGTGTTGRLAKWSDGGAGTLGDSIITESDGNVGVGAAPGPLVRLNIFSPFGTVPFGFTQNAPESAFPTLALFSTAEGPIGQYAATRHNGAGTFLMGATQGKNFGVFANNSYNAPHLFIKADGNVGVGTTDPQSNLQVNGFLQLGLTEGAPPADYCDDKAEYGRMKVDAVGVKLYVCTAAGWKSAALQ